MPAVGLAVKVATRPPLTVALTVRRCSRSLAASCQSLRDFACDKRHTLAALPCGVACPPPAQRYCMLLDSLLTKRAALASRCRSRDRRRTEFITEFTGGSGRGGSGGYDAAGSGAAGSGGSSGTGRILDALPGYDPAILGGAVPLPKSATEVQGYRHAAARSALFWGGD